MCCTNTDWSKAHEGPNDVVADGEVRREAEKNTVMQWCSRETGRNRRNSRWLVWLHFPVILLCVDDSTRMMNNRKNCFTILSSPTHCLPDNGLSFLRLSIPSCFLLLRHYDYHQYSPSWIRWIRCMNFWSPVSLPLLFTVSPPSPPATHTLPSGNQITKWRSAGAHSVLFNLFSSIHFRPFFNPPSSLAVSFFLFLPTGPAIQPSFSLTLMPG